MKRLWLADTPYLSNKVRKCRRKPKKGKKKGEKAPIHKPGIVKRLVERFFYQGQKTICLNTGQNQKFDDLAL